MREGFWYSEYEKDLPMPQANDKPWEGKDEFLDYLTDVESDALTNYWAANEGVDYEPCDEVIGMRGFSICRICGIGNGSHEFHINDWYWPEGLRHYIEEHNVRPSDEFIKFIIEG